MNDRNSYIVHKICEWEFKGLSILITATLIYLSERNKDIHLTRVLVFKTILRIFCPNLSIIIFVFHWHTASTFSVPSRIVSYATPRLRKIDTKKHFVKNCSPVSIVYQESTIFFFWIKLFIFIWQTFNIFINLFGIGLQFFTLRAPFSSPFSVTIRVSHSKNPVSLPYVAHFLIRYLKYINDSISMTCHYSRSISIWHSCNLLIFFKINIFSTYS